MIFLSLRVTADAEGGLKNRAHLRPVLQGFGGGQPPTSTRRVYTGALLATMVKAPKVQAIIGAMQRPIPKLQWEETGLACGAEFSNIPQKTLRC